MAIKEMLVTLRQYNIEPDKWKVIGPSGHGYKVLEFQRDIPSSMDKGTLTFKLQSDGDTDSPITLVGHVSLSPPAADTITKDGTMMEQADLHSEFRADTRFSFPRLKVVIVLVIDLKFVEGGVDDKFSFFGDTPLSHAIEPPL